MVRAEYCFGWQPNTAEQDKFRVRKDGIRYGTLIGTKIVDPRKLEGCTDAHLQVGSGDHRNGSVSMPLTRACLSSNEAPLRKNPDNHLDGFVCDMDSSRRIRDNILKEGGICPGSQIPVG
jgi:hypothetical protein